MIAAAPPIGGAFSLLRCALRGLLPHLSKLALQMHDPRGLLGQLVFGLVVRADFSFRAFFCSASSVAAPASTTLVVLFTAAKVAAATVLLRPEVSVKPSRATSARGLVSCSTNIMALEKLYCSKGILLLTPLMTSA